ncbi:hypothetical protein TUSST3_67720 [Streptomyces sp. TUS-ST3]|nr:hypothetical protein TUSST3_67720 [Streptomyces sp. TUS-ST3]
MPPLGEVQSPKIRSFERDPYQAWRESRCHNGPDFTMRTCLGTETRTSYAHRQQPLLDPLGRVQMLHHQRTRPDQPGPLPQP